MTAYLGAKLDLPPGAIERERCWRAWHGNGTAPETRERVARFLRARRARVRYAPDRRSHRRAAPPRSSWPRRSSTGSSASATGSTATSPPRSPVAARRSRAAGTGGADEVAPQTAFFQGNQAYAEGRYGDAVHPTNRCAAAGHGQRRARASTSATRTSRTTSCPRHRQLRARARRMLPRDPDVQANSGICARELAQVDDEAPPLWQRLAFPFAAADRQQAGRRPRAVAG